MYKVYFCSSAATGLNVGSLHLRSEKLSTTIIKNTNAIKRIHRNGNSAVVAIDPAIVKTLNLDAVTFCEQRIMPGGIFLEIKKLSPITHENIQKNEK